MFSNNSLRISLKIRLVSIYSLLFIVSCSLIFVVASYRIYLEMNRLVDVEAQRISRNMREVYELSLQPPAAEPVIPGAESIRNYPASDLEILQKRFPGMELLTAREENGVIAGNGGVPQKYYTASIFYQDKYYTCRVRSDGSVYSKLVKEPSHLMELRRQLKLQLKPVKPDPLKNLKRRFSELIRSRGHEGFLIVIRDRSTGKTVLSAGGNLQIHDKVLSGNFPEETAFEVGNFRYFKSEIPGLGQLFIGRSIRNRDRLVRQCMVIFFGVLFSVTGAGVAVAWIIARRFIHGIRQTTLAMKNISDGDYSYRIAEIPYTDEEIVTLMETFNDMNERTENLLNEIKMMSDNVAHDLRTPLTRISGTVELLLHDRELNEEVRNVCISVLEETLRLKALVNTVMDISRTTAHPDALSKEKLNLSRLIRNFGDFMQPGFEEKGLSLDLLLPEEEIIIEADKTMFQRMLANLVENALKFTKEGGVTIAVSKDNKSIKLSVEDSGCGIEEKDLPHIFDRFYRADASRHLSGNGLGLALVKAVALAHKWQLDVTSVTGKGTTFSITINHDDPTGG
ncbi:MAG: HAMP domain-containing histidine kinase [Lentisphaeria bacterium]|nr:HAMP domain-containing histidine kinase [Lentisphaeria bacterium]